MFITIWNGCRGKPFKPNNADNIQSAKQLSHEREWVVTPYYYVRHLTLPRDTPMSDQWLSTPRGWPVTTNHWSHSLNAIRFVCFFMYFSLIFGSKSSFRYKHKRHNYARWINTWLLSQHSRHINIFLPTEHILETGQPAGQSACGQWGRWRHADGGAAQRLQLPRDHTGGLSSAHYPAREAISLPVVDRDRPVLTCVARSTKMILL